MSRNGHCPNIASVAATMLIAWSAACATTLPAKRFDPVNLQGSKQVLPSQVIKANDGMAVFFLAPGQAHEHLIVDVPANQTSLTITAAGLGGNVDLYLSRVVTDASSALVPRAPARDQQPLVAATPAAQEVLTLEGATLAPGQYHITPVNNGASAASVSIQTRGTLSATIAQPNTNGYFNPQRDGHGVFLAATPTAWAIAWYTYDEAGDPIWYTGESTAPALSAGSWSTTLVKTTGSAAAVSRTTVGQATLTFDGSGGFRYSWSLNGTSGSEPLFPVGLPSCGSRVWSIGGVWLPSGETGWGSSLLVFPGESEDEIVYAFDATGEPRWAIGHGLFGISTMKEVYQVQGFCPTCAASPTGRTLIGSVTRRITSMDAAQFSSSFQWTGRLGGQWNRSLIQWTKLTPQLECP